jgi:hypothetical protein
VVETAIWRLLDIDEDDGRALTTHVGMRDRLNMLRTLFRLRRPDDAEKLDSLCEKIDDKLSHQRNELVHTLWVTGEYGSPMTLTVKARGTLEKTKRGISAKDIEAVAARIRDRSVALQDFLDSKGVVSPE